MMISDSGLLFLGHPVCPCSITCHITAPYQLLYCRVYYLKYSKSLTDLMLAGEEASSSFELC